MMAHHRQKPGQKKIESYFALPGQAPARPPPAAAAAAGAAAAAVRRPQPKSDPPPSNSGNDCGACGQKKAEPTFPCAGGCGNYLHRSCFPKGPSLVCPFCAQSPGRNPPRKLNDVSPVEAEDRPHLPPQPDEADQPLPAAMLRMQSDPAQPIPATFMWRHDTQVGGEYFQHPHHHEHQQQPEEGEREGEGEGDELLAIAAAADPDKGKHEIVDMVRAVRCQGKTMLRALLPLINSDEAGPISDPHAVAQAARQAIAAFGELGRPDDPSPSRLFERAQRLIKTPLRHKNPPPKDTRAIGSPPAAAAAAAAAACPAAPFLAPAVEDDGMKVRPAHQPWENDWADVVIDEDHEDVPAAAAAAAAAVPPLRQEPIVVDLDEYEDDPMEEDDAKPASSSAAAAAAAAPVGVGGAGGAELFGDDDPAFEDDEIDPCLSQPFDPFPFPFPFPAPHQQQPQQESESFDDIEISQAPAAAAAAAAAVAPPPPPPPLPEPAAADDPVALAVEDFAARVNSSGAARLYRPDPSQQQWFRETHAWSRELRNRNREIFGHDSFRGPQMGVINAVLSNRDAFVVMPTGGGKSLCFQLPAVVGRAGLVVVISPLRALMEDQVKAVKEKNVYAESIDQNTTKSKHSEILGALQSLIDEEDPANPDKEHICLLYVTPEKLVKSTAVQRVLKELYDAGSLKLVCVDEAHCVCQWGREFRDDYRKLGLIKKMAPKTPILALTASATDSVIRDVRSTLQMAASTVVFKQSIDRPNLFIEVRPKTPTCLHQMAQLIQSSPELQGGSGVVYCLSQKDCEEVATRLRDAFHITAEAYHAGMTDRNRKDIQRRWMSGDTQVVVATVAFGLGIDKADVRFVFHYSIPPTLDRYYQEIGRAGRDGRFSRVVLWYSQHDQGRQEKMAAGERGGRGRGGGGGRRLDELKRMTEFCDATDCRRILLLRHFGEAPPGADLCGAGCDNCAHNLLQGQSEEEDVTEAAMTIVLLVQDYVRLKTASGMYRLTQSLLNDAARGLNHKRIGQTKMNTAGSYGKLRRWRKSTQDTKESIDQLIRLLLNGKYLTNGVQKSTYQDFPVIKIGQAPQVKKLTSGNVTITMPRPRNRPPRRHGPPALPSGNPDNHQADGNDNMGDDDSPPKKKKRPRGHGVGGGRGESHQQQQQQQRQMDDDYNDWDDDDDDDEDDVPPPPAKKKKNAGGGGGGGGKRKGKAGRKSNMAINRGKEKQPAKKKRRNSQGGMAAHAPVQREDDEDDWSGNEMILISSSGPSDPDRDRRAKAAPAAPRRPPSGPRQNAQPPPPAAAAAAAAAHNQFANFAFHQRPPAPPAAAPAAAAAGAMRVSDPLAYSSSHDSHNNAPSRQVCRQMSGPGGARGAVRAPAPAAAAVAVAARSGGAGHVGMEGGNGNGNGVAAQPAANGNHPGRPPQHQQRNGGPPPAAAAADAANGNTGAGRLAGRVGHISAAARRNQMVRRPANLRAEGENVQPAIGPAMMRERDRQLLNAWR
ncbi:unnamed protein product [Vitrella brassicaformis CCMP3155]|uniref:DNA 3'-5' helicase n=1 Tax=Vitrella brassicaformis (strain CCMP3155) TaxID=1169540 RepID=A0A0G4EBN3_VITBC|nr:unnamed protein product [Vitrella brassicaformis CCMP3155]|eukprot:CEL92940.1 unnamed protein product [Vitrella brassicaformis CCMP3155]